jgi:hypothetical protein
MDDEVTTRTKNKACKIKFPENKTDTTIANNGIYEYNASVPNKS